MNPSNRTIEEKLAIVQQLRSNSNVITLTKPTDKTLKPTKYTQNTYSVQDESNMEESGSFLALLIIRIVICVILFCMIIFFGSKNPVLKHYINTMITTEENGNLIDFMSPFTYTLQENVESAPEVQDDMNSDVSVPSEE